MTPMDRYCPTCDTPAGLPCLDGRGWKLWSEIGRGYGPGEIRGFHKAREETETRVRCPYCQKLFEQKDIEAHIRRQHREVLD